MISHEPDEDADRFEDEDVLDDCPSFEPQDLRAPGRKADEPRAVWCIDWPATRSDGLAVEPDDKTRAWLQENFGGWRQAAGAILRTWVAKQPSTDPAAEPSD